jgi:glycosyltransferase involved in cell wall biosynthesis
MLGPGSDLMKVVHIFKDYYPPTTGGIEQHMSLLCRKLAAAGAEVVVMIPNRSRRRSEDRLNGVRIIRLPEFGRYASVPLCPTAAAEIRRLRPEIVHLHFPNPMGDLTYLLGASHIPLVVSYHSDIIKQKAFLPFYRPVLGRLFRRANQIMVASAEYMDSSPLLSRFRRKCALVPYGIEIETLALRGSEELEVASLRSAWGKRIVLFVGAFRYYKGLEVLLQALTRVAGRLVVAGRGTDGPSPRLLARQLGIEEKMVFCGEVDEARLRVLFNAADVFAFPSIDRCEAFGIAQLEAMACGKPVVASDLPTGVRLVNRHGVSGLLVPPGDAFALGDALNRILDDPELRAAYGRAARQRVEDEFTADRMVARTLQVYDEVLGR